MKKLFMIVAAIAISANVYANEPKFHALKDAKGASQMYNHESMFGTSGRHDEAHLPAYRGLHIGMTKAAVRENWVNSLNGQAVSEQINGNTIHTLKLMVNIMFVKFILTSKMVWLKKCISEMLLKTKFQLRLMFVPKTKNVKL